MRVHVQNHSAVELIKEKGEIPDSEEISDDGKDVHSLIFLLMDGLISSLKSSKLPDAIVSSLTKKIISKRISHLYRISLFLTSDTDSAVEVSGLLIFSQKFSHRRSDKIGCKTMMTFSRVSV